MTELVICGVPFEKDDETVLEALGELKAMGVTSVQIYTCWNMFEPEARGVFDWSFYDRQAGLLKKAGLKWVPFLIMGPRYVAPQWWIDSEDHVGMVCLEHGKETPCESIWSVRWREEIERVVAAFAGHYLPMDVIESIQPGICGDYGESIMPDIGNWPGSYHSHRGYWCGGDDARADLKRWAEEKFGTIEKLNMAWRTSYISFEQVVPMRIFQTPSRTAWFDFLQWYRDSMTDYTAFWLKCCRRYFPDLPVYMCLGGSEQPEHAASFSDQAKVCGQYNCGIRLTNEGNKFYDNYLWTSYCKNACDQYGAYFGLEPVGPITPNGVTSRIFGSAAYGNGQMFNYYSNIMGDDDKPNAGGEAFKRYIPLVQKRDQEPAAAMFWPGLFSAFCAANPDNLNEKCATGIPNTVTDALEFMRRQVNVLPVNEGMILDGGLDRYKVLVCPIAVFTRAEVLEKIAEWVANGGVLVSAGIMKDLEYRDVPAYIEALGLEPDYEVAIGNNDQEVQKGCGMKRLESFGEFHCTAGIIGMKPEVKCISAAKTSSFGAAQSKAAVAASEYDYGKGKSFLWNGLIEFQPDPDAVFPDSGYFQGFLSDILETYAGLDSLMPEEGEIARARIGEKMMALTKQYEIKEV